MNSGSWSINNKTVKSLHIGNKEIQTIERVSDGAIIYQRTEPTPSKIDTYIVAIGSPMRGKLYLCDINGLPVVGRTVLCHSNTDTDFFYTTDSNGAFISINTFIFEMEYCVFEGDNEYNGCQYSKE